MTKSTLFVLMAGSLFALPASADCVKCDLFQDCVADVNATACSCTVRVLHGTTICRESGVCDGPSSCDGGGGGPVALIKPFYIEGSAVLQLSKREPLLAIVLSGSIVPDTTGRMRQLDTDDYNGGTFRTEDGEVFRHRGAFTRQESGEVVFRFHLENANRPEKTEYLGTISSGGRHIRFSKIQTDEAGKTRRFAEDVDLAPAKN